jgi:subtilisin family serine protease
MTHQEFAGRIRLGFDVNGGSGEDCIGHGTHVAGIAAGATYGVAKEATIWNVKVGLEPDCGLSNASIIAGVDWVTANRQLPAVANMSLGGYGSNPPLETAVRNSIARGVVYVFAAGNASRDGCNFSPGGQVREGINVAASAVDDSRAGFSNYGSCVDLFAPGSGILSAADTGDTDSTIKSGTLHGRSPRGGCGRPLPGAKPHRQPGPGQERHLGQRYPEPDHGYPGNPQPPPL